MKIRLKFALPIALMLASAGAVAGTRLTPQECNAYPFVHTQAQVTHKDLVRELALLESVGYNPAADDPLYPSDIRSAERQLNAKYLADCHPAQTAAQTTAQTAPNVQ